MNTESNFLQESLVLVWVCAALWMWWLLLRPFSLKRKHSWGPVACIVDRPVTFWVLFLTFAISFHCTSCPGDSLSKCLSDPYSFLSIPVLLPSSGCHPLLPGSLQQQSQSSPCHPCLHWGQGDVTWRVVLNTLQGFDHPRHQWGMKWLTASCLKPEWPGLEFHSVCYAEQIPDVSKPQIRFHNFLRCISEDQKD